MESETIRDLSDPRPLIAGLAAGTIKRQVRELGNRVNELVLDILWPNNWGDQQAAYDALFAVCKRAVGRLFYREMRSELPGLVSDIDFGTANFIETAIDKFISGFEKLSLQEVAVLALRKHLGFVAGAVRNRLIDHLRHVYSKSKQADKTTARRIDGLADAAIVRATFAGLRKRLVTELGGAFETLRTLAEHYPFGDTRRERKGNTTRAVAKALHISEQQARARKRQLLQAAGASGIGVVRELVETTLA